MKTKKPNSISKTKEIPTWAELRKMSKETDLKLQETGRLMKETFKELRESGKETDRRMQETDRLMQETKLVVENTSRVVENTSRVVEETSRKVEEVSRQLGGIGNSNGEFAEDYFHNAFEQDPTLGKIHFDNVNRNVKPPLRAGNEEYDIVMVNKESVAIIETKYKAHKEHIEEITRKADTFRRRFPEYRKHKIYLGLASLNIRGSIIVNEAKKHGVALIRQRGGKLVVNDENMRAY